MTGQSYAATPYLARMAAEGRWQGQLVHDRHGLPQGIVAVRVGETFTDAVTIEGEDRCVAARVWTPRDDGLVLPSGPVWQRHGDCTGVLAELLDDLPDPDGDQR